MYLKNIFFALLIASTLTCCSLKCRNPEEIKVIETIKKTDIDLNCQNLSLEMIKAQAQMLEAANQKKEIEAYAVMPHCVHTTLMQVDRAINAAKTRVEYINYLQSHKKCAVGLGFQRLDNPDVVNQPITEDSIAEEPTQIMQRKLTPIKTIIPPNTSQ